MYKGFGKEDFMVPQKKILIIGKEEKDRQYISSFLSRKSFPTEEAISLNEAADKLISNNHYSMAIALLSPVDSNVLSLIHSIKTFNPQLGIMLLSNTRNSDLFISLLEKGIIDYVVSPKNLAGIFSALKNEFNKRDLIQKNATYQKRIQKYKAEQKRNIQKALDLEEIYDSTLENLMTALDLRDVETFGHSRTVARYSQVLAQILGYNDKTTLDNIRKGALLHDIGKIAIPDAILKKPSPLSAKEWQKIRLHPSLGFGLIKEIKLVKEVGNIILYHHEKYDGTGYPNKLSKDEIPSEARIFALADALDAITSHRPYRKERDFSFARKEIRSNSGTQFDPEIVDAFCSVNLKQWERVRYETTKLLPFMEDMLQLN
jgi:putative nucleotidyltransferase with HDIG domain